MNLSKTRIYIAIFVYLPFVITVAMNLIFSPYLLDGGSFWRELFSGFIFFSFVYLFFLLIYGLIPQKFQPYYVSFFLFLFLAFLGAFAYFSTYRSPYLIDIFNNFYAISADSLFIFFCTATAISLCPLFLIGVEKKVLFSSITGLLAFSLLLSAGKDLFHEYQINKFFRGYNEGKIIFCSSFNGVQEPYAFSLSNRKIVKIQEQNAVRHEEALSPDGKFKVYEYSYDRDDLSKIFISNRKTGETVFLAQGESPVWEK